MNRIQTSSKVKLNRHSVWKLLNRLDLTQNELARLTGISSGYMSQLMSGSRSPSAPLCRQLMEALGTSGFDELFTTETVLE